MPFFKKIQILPYTPRQLAELVLDIESYPEFLPWCSNAKIITPKPITSPMLAELTITFKLLTQSYVSKVEFTDEQNNYTINATAVSGPFKYLKNNWHFAPHQNGCQVTFTLDFRFKSVLLEKMIGLLFEKATTKMVDAFAKRADLLLKGIYTQE